MDKTYSYGNSWIEIDSENLKHNVELIRTILPDECELMPVLAANAYGHGTSIIGKELNKLGCNSFCVSNIEEALELRESGIEGEILILGYTHPVDFPLLTKYDLTQTIINFEHAVLLDTFGGACIKVQLEIDTGMHRSGIPSKDISDCLSILKMENLEVTGMFTHLCAEGHRNEENVAFTKQQITDFSQLQNELLAKGYLLTTHVINTHGMLYYPFTSGDYARIGLAVYGIVNQRRDLLAVSYKLKPVLSLKARVIAITSVPAGDCVGYGLAYTANRPRTIATISIGYADGLPRSLSCGRGYVLIRGHSAPIVGKMCMEQTMVDISNIDGVHCGDCAVIIGESGNSEITVYDLAEQAQTVSAEIVSRLSRRLPRVSF